MELQTLTLAKREACGKGAVGRLRKAGMLPGVLYGGDQDPMSVQIEIQVLAHLLAAHTGEHAVVQVEVEGEADLSTPALVKNVQHHPLDGHPVHADFMRVRLDQRIVTGVSIATVGHCLGVREGGVLDHTMREIQIECLVSEVPETIEVDVTDLPIGGSVHAGEIALPGNVTLITDSNLTVVAVHAPRVVEEEVPEEGEEGLEEGAEEGAEGPEVIGEKKDEE